MSDEVEAAKAAAAAYKSSEADGEFFLFLCIPLGSTLLSVECLMQSCFSYFALLIATYAHALYMYNRSRSRNSIR
jgi:hypothetical protein